MAVNDGRVDGTFWGWARDKAQGKKSWPGTRNVASAVGMTEYAMARIVNGEATLVPDEAARLGQLFRDGLGVKPPESALMKARAPRTLMRVGGDSVEVATDQMRVASLVNPEVKRQLEERERENQHIERHNELMEAIQDLSKGIWEFAKALRHANQIASVPLGRHAPGAPNNGAHPVDIAMPGSN